MPPAHRFPPPPSYSPLPRRTEKILSADAAPLPPPYCPQPHAVTYHTPRKMSADQVVIWLHPKPIFTLREYEMLLDIPLWHEMVQSRLDGALATAPGPESLFWEDVIVELEAERVLRLVAGCCVNSGAFYWIFGGIGRGMRGGREGAYRLPGLGVFMPHSSRIEDCQTRLFSLYRRQYTVSNDEEVQEPALHNLSRDLPLFRHYHKPSASRYQPESRTQNGKNPVSSPHTPQCFRGSFMKSLSGLLSKKRDTLGI
ncbi:hypothetical protein HOY80DRAFT_266327 [Tuber brumale]|nr:hypothetical protein HOY80DRAFT_266327 [Tuber brumale]